MSLSDLSEVLSDLSELVFTKTVVIAVVSIVLTVYLIDVVTVHAMKWFFKIRYARRKRSYPKDVVILHQFPRGFRLPNDSPFCLKLETWLRMANIKYQNEFGYTFGPKGKIPFITYNGEEVADSQFCIEFLSKKFDKNFSKNFSSSKDIGAARAFFKMTEESLFWVVAIFRIIYESDPKYIGISPLFLWIARRQYKKRLQVQGYGRHSKEEVLSIGKHDLKSLNDFLQGKKYLIGDKPCDEDASVFGTVAQIVYGDNGSLNKFVKEECPNIVAYIENMKKTYWPDWDDCIRINKAKKADTATTTTTTTVTKSDAKSD